MTKRTQEIGKNYKRIHLTLGKSTIVDAEDHFSLTFYKWSAFYDKKSRNFYAVRTLKKNGKSTTIRMSRQIMNTQKGMHADHINHNTLDNRKLNLRNCTPSQNYMNSKTYQNNTSGTTGVAWNKERKKWHSLITVNKNIISLGFFKDKSDAIKARKKGELKYFGEFAIKLEECE